jgi:hypothetical protein
MFSFLNKTPEPSEKLIPFQLPIEYTENKHELSHTIVDDLELTTVRDSSTETKCLYNYLISPQTKYGEKMIPAWSKHYSTCPNYLKETKQIISEYKDISLETDKIDVFYAKWSEIKDDTAFDSKFFYIDVKQLAFLNKFPLILQGLSLYNFGAPFLSLLAPVFIFILPFFLLKATGTGISLTTYRTILMEQLRRQAFWRLFSQEGGSIQHKLYLLFSVVMYIFNIYQNIVMCVKFYKNFNFIFDFFHKASTYMEYISREMKKFGDYCRPTKAYEMFNATTGNIYNTIRQHCEKLTRLQPFTFSLTKFGYIGQVMYTFYEFKHNFTLRTSIDYSIDFFGYLDNIKGIQYNIDTGYLNFGDIKEEEKKTGSIRGVYYPNLAGSENCVRNDIKLCKNYAISGPNASGKTTLLKTILVNIIFTQQVGCGFYKSCEIMPYHRLHCYLNIPDTSGRDSLFQAEARRCKEIVDSIQSDISLNHFCVFDELYSGTNPYEAVASAFSYLAYLAKYSNVNIMITTHFLNLCELLERKEKYKTIQMETDVSGGDAVYKYKIKKGISRVTCGIRVLRQLNYPQEILDKVAVFSFN